MSYFKSENTPVPKVEATEIPKGVTYTAKFIVAGPVGYKDGVYLLPQENLDQFAWTLKGCPVVINHQDIDDVKEMKEKAVGYVSNVERCEETGAWYADFVVFDPKAIKKISDGETPYVSCAYRADLTDEGCEINNVQYKKKIVGGEMLHLALVKNPRYNGTEIWRNSKEDYVVSEGVLFNQKESAMFGFKKVKAELDKDVLVNTKLGEKTIEELINELEAAHDKIAEHEAKIADLEARNAELEATKVVAPVEGDEKTSATTDTPATESETGTDAELKKDLNNSLTGEVKVEVVQVPNIK